MATAHAPLTFAQAQATATTDECNSLETVYASRQMHRHPLAVIVTESSESDLLDACSTSTLLNPWYQEISCMVWPPIPVVSHRNPHAMEQNAYCCMHACMLLPCMWQRFLFELACPVAHSPVLLQAPQGITCGPWPRNQSLPKGRRLGGRL